MRNRLRVLAFDVAAPLAAIAALIYIGVVLAWPLWWVSVASVLCLLIVEGVVVNVGCCAATGSRVGTDDDGAGTATGGCLAGRRPRWSPRWCRLHAVDGDGPRPAQGQCRSRRHRQQCGRGQRDVHAASPTAAIDRAAEMMAPERADKYKTEFAAVQSN